jgi:hypothetical protein
MSLKKLGDSYDINDPVSVYADLKDEDGNFTKQERPYYEKLLLKKIIEEANKRIKLPGFNQTINDVIENKFYTSLAKQLRGGGNESYGLPITEEELIGNKEVLDAAISTILRVLIQNKLRILRETENYTLQSLIRLLEDLKRSFRRGGEMNKIDAKTFAILDEINDSIHENDTQGLESDTTKFPIFKYIVNKRASHSFEDDKELMGVLNVLIKKNSVENGLSPNEKDFFKEKNKNFDEVIRVSNVPIIESGGYIDYLELYNEQIEKLQNLDREKIDISLYDKNDEAWLEEIERIKDNVMNPPQISDEDKMDEDVSDEDFGDYILEPNWTLGNESTALAIPFYEDPETERRIRSAPIPGVNYSANNVLTAQQAMDSLSLIIKDSNEIGKKRGISAPVQTFVTTARITLKKIQDLQGKNADSLEELLADLSSYAPPGSWNVQNPLIKLQFELFTQYDNLTKDKPRSIKPFASNPAMVNYLTGCLKKFNSNFKGGARTTRKRSATHVKRTKKHNKRTKRTQKRNYKNKNKKKSMNKNNQRKTHKRR